MRTIDVTVAKAPAGGFGWNVLGPNGRVVQRAVIAKAENGSTGYGLGAVPSGESARQEFGGPLIDGPWLYTFGLATTLAVGGGTGADIARERAAGQLIELEAGDRLRWDGRLYEVRLCPRRYPSLVEVADA